MNHKVQPQKNMNKDLCKVWSASRKVKKCFLCVPSIPAVLQKATDYALSGEKLVLESDGTEIDDDEVLEYVLKDRCTLMILNRYEIWTPNTIFPTVPSTNSSISSEARYNVMMVDSFQMEDERNAPESSGAEFDFATANMIKIEEMKDEDSEHVPGQSYRTQDPDDVLGMDEAIELRQQCKSKVNPKISANTSSTGDLFLNFEIPWAKMPPVVKQLLKQKKFLGKSMRIFSNVVVDELRQHSTYIPMPIYRLVAQRAAERYPSSFIERDGMGNIISHMPIALITTMRNRNNFLNLGSRKSSAASNWAAALARSCVNWQPEPNGPEKDVFTKKLRLLELYKHTPLSQDELETAQQFMLDCFGAQRSYFNYKKVASVKGVLNNWPMIFNRDCLYDHFAKLMELDVRVFKIHFAMETPKMLDFFKLNAEDGSREILKAICSYFHEEDFLLSERYESGTLVDDIKTRVPPSIPWIAIIDKSADGTTEEITHIWMNREITATYKNCDFLDSVLQVLCYYYTFNIAYPKSITQTFEFLMRYFFKFYPSQIRGEKSHINNLKKINTLIMKLDN